MPKVVQMGEIGVSFINEASYSDARKPVLTTEGISTCIAIILRGRVSGRSFCAMYHWSGFSADFTSEAEAFPAIYNIFLNIEEEIRKASKIPPSTAIEIAAICIIGGEKQQINEDKTLEISGTEKEVESLKTYTFEICTEMFELNPGVTPVFKNFLTEGTATIDIQVYATHVKYQKYEGAFFEHTNNNSKKRLMTDQESESEEEYSSHKRVRP